MSVGLEAGEFYAEIGSASFLHAFFSTVSGNLEQQWGQRFPVLMKQLYQGELPANNIGQALAELEKVRGELEKFEPDDVIWDIDERDARPPWGDNISPEITSLSNYFVTSDGRDLFEAVAEILTHASAQGLAVRIV